ncbi:MAG: hypothetical protein ACKO26_24605 [Planctomycetota bacterium]
MVIFRLLLLSGIVLVFVNQSCAQSGVVVRETVEFLLKKFGKEATEFGTENLTKKVAFFASKYGDDAIIAMKKVGPASFKYIEDAGEQGRGYLIKAMAKHGSESLHVVAKPGRLAIFIKYGDEAGEVMLKHGEMCDPIISRFGTPAVKALAKVSDNQVARRIVLLQDEPALATKMPELLDTIGKYGEKTVTFIWNNKGALATTSVLAAFLADPQPFIDGTRDLVKIPLDRVASVPNDLIKEGAKEAAKKTNFTLLGVLMILSITGVILFRIFLKRQTSKVNSTALK